MNQLYYGDNLHVLRDHILDESVDLIHLDLPFNSKRDYNLLFKSPKTGKAGSPLPAASKQDATNSSRGAHGVTCPTSDSGAQGAARHTNEIHKTVVSVKGGEHLKADDIRSLMAVRERESAGIAVVISPEEPTRDMLKDAASAGFYESPNGKKFPRVQLLAIGNLLEAKPAPNILATSRIRISRRPRRKSRGAEEFALITFPKSRTARPAPRRGVGRVSHRCGGAARP